MILLTSRIRPLPHDFKGQEPLKITAQSGKHSLGGAYQVFIDSKLYVHVYMEQGEPQTWASICSLGRPGSLFFKRCLYSKQRGWEFDLSWSSNIHTQHTHADPTTRDPQHTHPDPTTRDNLWGPSVPFLSETSGHLNSYPFCALRNLVIVTGHRSCFCSSTFPKHYIVWVSRMGQPPRYGCHAPLKHPHFPPPARYLQENTSFCCFQLPSLSRLP